MSLILLHFSSHYQPFAVSLWHAFTRLSPTHVEYLCRIKPNCEGNHQKLLTASRCYASSLVASSLLPIIDRGFTGQRRMGARTGRQLRIGRASCGTGTAAI